MQFQEKDAKQTYDNIENSLIKRYASRKLMQMFSEWQHYGHD